MRAEAIPYYAYFVFLITLASASYGFYFKGWPRLKKAIHPWPFIFVGFALFVPLYFLPELRWLFFFSLLPAIPVLLTLSLRGGYCPICGALRLKTATEEACPFCEEEAAKGQK